MALYLLETASRDYLGSPSFLITNREIVQTRLYEEKILMNQFYTSPEVIELLLTDVDDGRAMVLRDYHRWDLGRPNASVLAVSGRFKSVLEQLVLPPHRFYEASVYIKEEEKAYEYYICHFIFDYLEHIDFAKSAFHIITSSGDVLIKAFEQGEIQSAEEFHKINKEATAQKKPIFMHGREFQSRCFLRPVKIQFKQEAYFDVWKLRGQTVLSEKAKQAIDAAGMTGVVMPEMQQDDMFKGIEITMDQK